MTVRPVIRIHTVLRRQHLTAALLCGIFLCDPAYGQHLSPSLGSTAAGVGLNEAPQERRIPAVRHRDLRPLASFGITVAIQTFGVLTATAVAGACDKFSDQSIIIGWGVVAGIAPAASGTASWALGSSSRTHTSPIGGILVGAYVGAAMGYLATFLTVRKDNPEADGRYDPIYFGRNDAANVLLNITAYGLAPVFLPAIGAAVGHLLIRKPLDENRAVAFRPPSVQIYKTSANPDTPVIGIRLIGGAF